MMEKKDLIKFCRYYMGEQKCPFSNGSEASLWSYERAWVEFNVDNIKGREHLADLVNDYARVGLSLFEIHDDTPVTLKALLFNRYCKWNSASMYECVDGFKSYYKKTYIRK